MNDLKELGKLMKEHPIIIVVTLAAMAVGAILGAVAEEVIRKASRNL